MYLGQKSIVFLCYKIWCKLSHTLIQQKYFLFIESFLIFPFKLKLLSNKFHFFLFLFMSNSPNTYLFTIPASHMFIWHIPCICLTWHDIGHLNLGDRFYRVRWVLNPFPSRKLASKPRSTVLDYSRLYSCIYNFTFF